MSENNNRASDLAAKIREVASARNLAAERFARHQKLSLWTLAYLALLMVLIPLIQVTEIPTGISSSYLLGVEVVLAVLVLIYALLVGLEKFVAQGSAMKRCSLELERLAQQIAAKQRITDAEHSIFTNEFYDVLDKFDNHARLDSLLVRLANTPKVHNEWPKYLYVWGQAQLLKLCHYMHYLVALAFTGFILFTLLNAITRYDQNPGPELRSDTTLRLYGDNAPADNERSSSLPTPP